MPFALQLYFDPVTEGAVRGLWQRFAETGITSYLHESANRPHVTLVGYDALDLERAEEIVTTVARARSPFSLTFSHLGAFLHPSPVVFLAPTPTVDLLRLHHLAYEASAAIGRNPWEAYLPGRWVPHCTIAFHMGAASLLKVIEASQEMQLPQVGTVTQLGLAAVSPTTLLFSIRLQRRS